ncbi:MAG: carbohydrate ABC transporter permease [Candidatus Bathyarchaeia archaeon]
MTIKWKKNMLTALHIIGRVIIVFFVLAPVYWVINSSFIKEAALANVPPPAFPARAVRTFSHYRFIIFGEASAEETVMLQAMYTASGVFILPAIKNSIIIALLTVTLSLLLAVPAGYTFARRSFRGKDGIYFAFLAVRLLPSLSIAIPVFLLFKKFGLLDSIEGLVIINTATSTPLAIWILRPYFEAIPKDFEEAALIDGCGYFQLMTRVVLPLARPGLIAAAIFVFMMAYSEFIFALTLTSTLRARPVSVVVATLAQGLSVSKGMLSAGIVLSFLPPVVLGIIFRRYIVGGLTGKVFIDLK